MSFSKEESFSQKHWSDYKQCLAIVPYLRHLGKRQLEEVLEQFQTEAEMLIRMGYQQLPQSGTTFTTCCGGCVTLLQEAHVVTNYRTLLDEIKPFPEAGGDRKLVTFNYDTLLEPAYKI